MEEKICVIEGTKGKYTVSNLGKIYKEGKEVEIKHQKNGYCCVPITLIFGTRHFLVHRIVAAYFIPNEDESKDQVNHIDGNKDNNSVSNLEWVTNTENQRHRIDILGKNNKGTSNPMYGVNNENSPVFKGYIYKIDPNTGEVIDKYAGSGDAHRRTGYSRSNILKSIYSGKLFHGYKWTR